MKTKTLIALFALVLMLSACEPRASIELKYTEVMQTIPELYGCKTFGVYDGNKQIYVTRCPASETISTSSADKNPMHSMTIGDPNIVMDSDNTNSR